MNVSSALLIFALVALASANRFKNLNYVPGRTTMVHMFEWKWDDIANECERFLGPKGFGGVQVSPVTENVIEKNRPWWERYQPVSYKLTTRSGDEAQFASMVRRCNNAGVRVYVDVLLNHMAAINPSGVVGTGGSVADPESHTYPAVGYTSEHFHQPVCSIEDYEDPVQIRICELVGLRDLNQTHPYVREKITEFLNHLVDLGVAGFRFDAARHMWPADLKFIYGSVKPLNVDHGFPKNSYPFMFQEVIDGESGRWSREYTPLAPITEFKYSANLNRIFRRHVHLKFLHSWGTGWGFVRSEDSLVFVDNHDNQRDGAEHRHILTYHTPREYIMATAWALAHPYGNIRIMSSFAFRPWEKDVGPPQDKEGNLLSPVILNNGRCAGGFICEHRWPQITKMVEFRNIANGSSVSNWWDNGFSQIAISREKKAFIALNNEFRNDLKTNLATSLPAGEYCDIISGERNGNDCTGTKVVVDHNGSAFIYIPYDAEYGVLAIHVGSTSRIA